MEHKKHCCDDCFYSYRSGCCFGAKKKIRYYSDGKDGYDIRDLRSCIEFNDDGLCNDFKQQKTDVGYYLSLAFLLLAVLLLIVVVIAAFSEVA